MTPDQARALEHAVMNLREALEGLESSRERSLAITKLDECEMWAMRS
jgi:hypothetical protein